MAYTKVPLPQRFFDKVQLTEELHGDTHCLIWTGYRVKQGHGRVWDPSKNRVVPAHQFAYEMWIGPVPAGKHLDHLCCHPWCVNVLHLEPVTPGENTRRARGVSDLVCRRGHLRTAETTHFRGNVRFCRLCQAEDQRRYTARLRAVKAAA
jgi:hypothetical protein